MNSIECPECGKEQDSNNEICMECGFENASSESLTKNNEKTKIKL